MRTAISGTWLFGLVAIFIVIFSSYLAISINYSKVFKVKNGVVSILEKNEGLNDVSEEAIEKYLDSNGYKVYGKCPTDWTPIVLDTFSSKSKCCIKEMPGNTPGYSTVYYHVMLFFRFDLPVLGNIFTFKIPGNTKEIYIFS